MKKEMKTTLFALAAGFVAVATSYAGPMQSMPMKQMEVMPPPQAPLCFTGNEFTVDAFGAAIITSDDEYFGGGVGFNYFVSEYLGFGVDGYWFDDDSSVIHSATGSVILRFPIQDICLAPYVYGGGGVHTNSHTDGSGHVGGGLEWRMLEGVGLFADGRYTFVDRFEDDGFTLVKAGLRFAF